MVKLERSIMKFGHKELVLLKLQLAYQDAATAEMAIMQLPEDEITFLLKLVTEDMGSRTGLIKKKSKDHRSPPKDYVCRKCNVAGHWVQDCPLGPSGRSLEPPEGYVCHKCNRAGHWIEFCPFMTKIPTINGFLMQCQQCGQHDHDAATCPMNQEPEPTLTQEDQDQIDSFLKCVRKYNKKTKAIRKQSSRKHQF